MIQQKIRNFSIIAHVDHGKSTLADRLLEITETVPKEKLREQFLDQNPIERERGITIKLAPVRMNYMLNAINYVSGEVRKESLTYMLNLIDTPGHVDFSYEVSRSLAAVEGAILLVDASVGIQAQTISNFNQCLALNLTIIPVINKIDLPTSNPKQVAKEMCDTFGFRDDEIIFISAKTGKNVEKLLEAIVQRIPPPKGDIDAPLKALVFDSAYDQFKGVIVHIRVFDGILKENQQIKFFSNNTPAQSIEVGIFVPQMIPIKTLSTGEIGYVATGLKDVAIARVGDTLTDNNSPTSSPIPGFKNVKPMVFAAFYPVDNKNHRLLTDALAKLKLNDASLLFEPEYSEAIGAGFRVGFLGLLHMEVVQERLEREYNLSLIASLPTVSYRVEKTDGKVITVERPSKLPPHTEVKTIEEPIVLGNIIVPKQYLGGVLELLAEKRGSVKNMEYKGEQVIVDVDIPLAEIIIDFYNRLKNISSGYATFDYELSGMAKADVVKLDILVAHNIVDALSLLVMRKNAEYIGRRMVEKLKDSISRQQFEVAVQATIGGKIVARADIPAFRKDVTAKLYGGDRTRKDKLLESQKKGKKRMKMVGRVEIPQDAFLSILKI